MPLQIALVVHGQFADALVEVHAHILHSGSNGFIIHFHVHQELARHRLEGVCRPFGEPVDCRTIDQGREFAQSLAERVSNRRHGQHQMQICAAAFDEKGVQARRGEWLACPLGPRSDELHDGDELVLGKQIGHLASVQDVVDVLQKRLVFKLSVGKQKHRRRRCAPGLFQHAFQVLPPLVRGVGLADFDGEELVVGHERRDANQALASTAPHPHQQSVSVRRLNNATDATDVLGGVEEEHKVHSRLGHRVVVGQVVLDHGEQFSNVGDFFVLARIGVRDLKIAVQDGAKDADVAAG
mmetsp:Transcript_3268/g.5386  ORF Transcript_3268/g.5386 Transcript_3268/m.5386 type:complete len:296 (+) Transcript_3268:3168-4055(+)